MAAQKPKTEAEITAMREGGKILAGILHDVKGQVAPGVTELALNEWVAKAITARGATPTYKEPSVNFPGVICISTNDQVVHSVPSEYALQAGDVVSFDLVITYKGMKTDAAFTMIVPGGKPSADVERLLTLTERSLYAGIDAARVGARTGDIGAAVAAVLDGGHLGIVRELVGHGVGHEMHMAPDVPNYGNPGTGALLRAGDTIAIEPMATLGDYHIVTDKADGWTIRTADGSLAAHFEHTILITEDGPEILTKV